MAFGKSLFLFFLSTAAVHNAALAQEAAPPAEEPLEEDGDYPLEDEGEAIVVTGQRRGTVIGDIPPEITLDAADIRAYGAGSITELLDALAPQTQSGRGRGEGRPIVLVNGRRISGFSEIRDLPPEAIERTEIFPEEVALKYGYRADQRVVNIVLRERFRAVTAEIEGGLATAGGRGTYEADLNVLRINRNGRWNVDLEYERATPLFESERDLIADASGPFAIGGNVGPGPGSAEVDPALSALVGVPVTIAGVPGPAAAAAPALGDFVAGANVPNVSDLGRYRTLLAATEEYSVAGTINRTIFNDVSASLNARYEGSENESGLGLPGGSFALTSDNPFSPFGSDVTLFRAFDLSPLVRESSTRTAHLGVALNGDIAPWRWAFTGNFDRVSSRSRTDTGLDPSLIQARIDAGDPEFNPFGPVSPDLIVSTPRDLSRSTNQSAEAEMVLNGPITDLPAGELSTSLKAGFELRDFESETMRAGLNQTRDLSRDRANVQANLDIPIADRGRDVLSAIGDLSANANIAFDRLSDFGTLRTLGFGINWSPIEEVRLIASMTDEEGAPSVQQLGDPSTLTPNVRVFDFLTGETVDIARLDGGNPALLADNRRVMKLGLRVRPLSETDLSLSADYNRSRIDNVIASFPTATPEIEAAFPDRFTRDDDGRLLQIDSRPVNFARSDREELRWGINFSKPISQSPRGGRGEGRHGRGQAAAEGATPPAAEGQAGTAAAPRAETSARAERREARRAERGRGGGRGFGRGGRRGGRLQLSLYHTWHLQDEILIREGVPVLDLLNGSAAGNRGGRSEHEVEIRAGLFKDGFGARLNANWQSGTFVRGPEDGLGGSTGDLAFSDFTTLNLRLFANLGQQRSLVRQHRWLRGTRVTLAVNNLLDSRLDVRDENGATPLGYQPDLLDPLGRTVTLNIRKQFF